jgi:hypothetical protein
MYVEILLRIMQRMEAVLEVPLLPASGFTTPKAKTNTLPQR